MKKDGMTHVARVVSSQVKLYYDRQSVGQSVLVSGAPFEPATNFSSCLELFLDNYWFNYARLLWWEVGSVVGKETTRKPKM
jgi:hypothetical protein